MMGKKDTGRQKWYMEYITSQMINYAQLNFDSKLEIIYDEEIDELVPGLAVGVNILGEELQLKVEELQQLNTELEKRNQFIKSITDVVPEVIYVFNRITSSITYLNKCTNTDSILPCPAIIDGLGSFCNQCSRFNGLPGEKKAFEVEKLNENEIRVRSNMNNVKWYKATVNDFELDGNGQTVSVLKTLTDITLIKEKETKLLENERVISNSLKEKELLLQEIHHRVKNNLQIISGLLNLQSSRARSEEVVGQLQEIRSRIHSISLIHEELYQTDSFTNVDISTYCRKLCTSLSALYNVGNAVEVIYDLDPNVHLSIDKATPLGLLINEVICNCYKHGFVNDKPGKIWVGLKSNKNHYELQIKDNGVGETHKTPMDKGSNGLGNKLIKGLAMQLDAELDIKTNPGYTIRLSIPKIPQRE